MKIHVICCNDAVISAVVENEARAGERMEELAQADFERQRSDWELPHGQSARFAPKDKTPYQNYRARLYWHIHTVEGE